MTEPAFYNFKSRLAQYRGLGGDQAFWEERWSQRDIGNLLSRYQSGKLDEFEEIFSKYLPRDLPILEAGCGMGQFVMSLTARGYKAEGIDYAAETIARVKDVAPELKLSVGDVLNLDVPDGTFGGYISLGIFEHNPDGPLEGLREVRRVLHPRGVALISVPYLNRQRQTWLSQIPIASDPALSNGLNFYQYYFSRNEFASFLQKAGLTIVDVLPYSTYSGLTRDYQLGRRLHDLNFYHWRLRRRFSRMCSRAPMWARSRWAHMIMFACQIAE